MKAKCPNDATHTQFTTTAHVVQTWKVDAEGNFLEEISTDETIASPHVQNDWNCVECAELAVFE